jgi:hypothetical protein
MDFLKSIPKNILSMPPNPLDYLPGNNHNQNLDLSLNRIDAHNLRLTFGHGYEGSSQSQELRLSKDSYHLSRKSFSKSHIHTQIHVFCTLLDQILQNLNYNKRISHILFSILPFVEQYHKEMTLMYEYVHKLPSNQTKIYVLQGKLKDLSQFHILFKIHQKSGFRIASHQFLNIL